MKKIFVIMIALLLAVPAMSFAGSATSRFDLTIGGNVNFNFGYQTQNTPNDGIHAAARGSSSTGTNLNAEYGNARFSVADSQINFLSRGPEAWGAKTSGFLQIDFRGSNTGGQQGNAQIQYAFVKFDWAKGYLVAGKSGPEALSAYARKFIIAGDASSTEGIGGPRPWMIAYRYNWTKNFNTLLGIYYHTQQDGNNAVGQGNNNGYGRSKLPALISEIGFSSDACGVIGPDMLKFGLGGLIAKETKTYFNAASANANTYAEDNVNVWMAGLRAFVPIIPEKKGNKTNALGFSAIGYIGQNNVAYVGTPAPGAGSYWRGQTGPYSLPASAAAPTMYGGFAQLTYYINNETFVNAQYGVLKENYSSAARAANAVQRQTGNDTDWLGPNQVNQFRVYGASIFHDPSPSVRVGFEWLRFYTNYNNYGQGAGSGSPGATTTYVGPAAGYLDSSGKMDQFKAMVMYFF